MWLCSPVSRMPIVPFGFDVASMCTAVRPAAGPLGVSPGSAPHSPYPVPRLLGVWDGHARAWPSGPERFSHERLPPCGPRGGAAVLLRRNQPREGVSGGGTRSLWALVTAQHPQLLLGSCWANTKQPHPLAMPYLRFCCRFMYLCLCSEPLPLSTPAEYSVGQVEVMYAKFGPGIWETLAAKYPGVDLGKV